MSLSAAAQALGLPEALVKRSAEARAAETGTGVDEILAAWSGGGSVESPAEPEPAPSEAPSGEEAATETPTETTTETPAVPPQPVVTTAEPSPPTTPTRPTRAPVPAEVSISEAAQLPEVITVPTAGIRERTNFAMPRWLTALMLIAPLVALFALGGSATGACGEATELQVDVITGEVVNCDGTEFTGGGAGGGGVDFVAMGGEIYSGGAVAGVNCAGCHGAGGQGSGSFPALTGVLTTFGSCADHIEWVSLGTEGFAGLGLTTYGDTNKRLGGGGTMPGFAGTLTEEQIAAVAAFERVRFGGGDPEETLVDCGLAEGEGEGGEGEAPGDAVTPGEGEGDGGVPTEPPTDEGTPGTGDESEAPSDEGDSPSDVGDSPSDDGDSPSDVGDSPSDDGDSP